MDNRNTSFATLLIVIGVSIVFGMVVGGRLNSPRVALAAPAVALDTRPIQLAPAVTGGGPVGGFADVVEAALPAVVGVTSTKVDEQGDVPENHPFLDDPFFRRFFQRSPDQGQPDPQPQPRQRPRVGEGSGFIISRDGYIMTNNHVVENSDQVEVTLQGGRQYKASVIGADPSIDLALLKIDPEGEPLPMLALGDSDDIRLGEWVIAIGNPLDFDLTVTLGIISGKERRVPIGSTDTAVVSFIQTDAAINFGNSGGPLIDARGNVIGINTAIRRADFAEGIGFALPINDARAVVEQLRERGYVKRGFIGITMNDNGLDDEAREYYGLPDTNGVIVSSVQSGGPADRAGVRGGDIIRKVDGRAVRDNFDLVSKIASKQPGDRVRLELFRSGETITISATLEDRQEGLEARFGGGGDGGQSPMPEEPEEPRQASGFGVTVESIDDRTRERLGLANGELGVIVTDVAYDSEAAQKGVQPMMIVTGINDRPVTGISEWSDRLHELDSGAPVKLDLLLPQPGDREPVRRYVYLRAPESD